MTVETGDIIRTACNFDLEDGSQYQNVYHHVAVSVSGIADSLVTSSVKTWVETAYGDLATVIRALTTASVCYIDKLVWDTDHWEVTANVGSFTPTFSPQSAGSSQPNQLSPFVIFKTLRPKTVGRKFLFPFTELEYVDARLTATAVTAMVNYADEILTDIVPGVGDRLISGIPRTAVEFWYDFALAVVTNIAGTQRRRRFGVGA